MDPSKISWMRPWTVPNTTVLYTEQELTEEQQAQARENIGISGSVATKEYVDQMLGVIENGTY